MSDATAAWENSPDWGQIRLNGTQVPVVGGVSVDYLNTFPRKVGIGAADRDSDELLSVWAMTNWSGGGQVAVLRPGVDEGRFRRGNLHTRDPYQLCLARQVQTFAHGTNTFWPLGELNDVFYGAFDRAVRAYTTASETFAAAVATLAFEPVNTGFLWGATTLDSAPVLWVPCGANGYQTFDGTTLSAVVTTIAPIAFAECFDTLWALTTTGGLWFWDDTILDWSQDAQISRRHTVRNLTTYWNTSSEPTLHVVTDKGLLSYQRDIQKFYPAGNRELPHPHAGHGFTTWSRQGNLFYSVGMYVARYELGAIEAPAPGLDRDDGLPPEYRGYIQDLKGAPDELWALVHGSTETLPESGTPLDADTVGDADATFPPTATFASVHYLTQGGWHEAWSSAEAAGEPTKLHVSPAGNEIRLWWGHGGTAYSIWLPQDPHKPRESMVIGLDRFEPTGTLRTGQNDMQMMGFVKTAAYLQGNIVHASATEPIIVRCQRDFETGWTELGRFTESGIQSIDFGDEGLSFERIEFEFEFSRPTGNVRISPMADSFVLHFVKRPHAARAWSFQLSIDWGETRGENGMTATELKQFLADLLAANAFVTLSHAGEEYRVSLSAVTGADGTGQEERGVRNISCVEIPPYRGATLVAGEA